MFLPSLWCHRAFTVVIVCPASSIMFTVVSAVVLGSFFSNDDVCMEENMSDYARISDNIIKVGRDHQEMMVLI